MSARRDAMLGAAQMAGAIAEVADEIGHPAVATTGKWSVQPGGSNIVPEQVTFTIDARHPDEAVLDGMLVAVARRCTEIAAQRHLEVSIDTVKRENASPTDQALRAVLASAAERQGATSCHLPSGAGHDSQLFARHLPTAMLFVPSVEGRSHVKEEYTPPEPCAVGANVLATALHQLAYTH
jgi:allantoate deiminase